MKYLNFFLLDEFDMVIILDLTQFNIQEIYKKTNKKKPYIRCKNCVLALNFILMFLSLIFLCSF